jgi:hypothetical protein
MGPAKKVTSVKEFEKRHGHDHNPSQCPTRFLSAAERSRKQRDGTVAVTEQRSRARAVSIEIALELRRDGHFDMAASKVALNEKRLPHSISDRSEKIISDFHKKQSNSMK